MRVSAERMQVRSCSLSALACSEPSRPRILLQRHPSPADEACQERFAAMLGALHEEMSHDCDAATLASS